VIYFNLKEAPWVHHGYIYLIKYCNIVITI